MPSLYHGNHEINHESIKHCRRIRTPTLFRNTHTHISIMRNLLSVDSQTRDNDTISVIIFCTLITYRRVHSWSNRPLTQSSSIPSRSSQWCLVRYYGHAALCRAPSAPVWCAMGAKGRGAPPRPPPATPLPFSTMCTDAGLAKLGSQACALILTPGDESITLWWKNMGDLLEDWPSV